MIRGIAYGIGGTLAGVAAGLAFVLWGAYRVAVDEAEMTQAGDEHR